MAGRFGGMKAQCACHGAPCAIQRFKVSICSGLSCRAKSGGGMCSSGSVVVMRLSNFIERRACGGLHIEAETGFELRFVRPVTLEAGVGKDGADVTAELDALLRVQRQRGG